MLARLNGQVVLVWGAIPGEHVCARVEQSRKGVLFAETIEVLESSPDRRPAPADWRCGGNVLAHIGYERQLHIKSEIIRDAFAHIGRLPLAASPVVTASPEEGYRMRARFHVRGARIGFVREGSHEICAVGPTRQLLPATVTWIEEAEARLRADGLRGLTSIEIAENIAATERACHLELEPGSDAARFTVLATDAVSGLSAQVLDRRGIETLEGAPTISDSIGSLVLKRDVRAFFQGNRFLLENLVRHARERIPERGPLVDLYAGVGLFGLSLAAVGRDDITLVEGDVVSAHDLEENARPFAGRVRVERSSVEAFLRHQAPAADATFIIDPPRTGISQEAARRILRARPAHLLYVSCDVATLARDVRAFADGGYALEQIDAFDLFPNTAHVECVCLLRREADDR
jgi:23S rRNA (uracil1939-C5)-methyltransferase